ncbi:MAG: MarR family winged helix-turn-helix transcriptional regulator [Acidobacteriota bacterium]
MARPRASSGAESIHEAPDLGLLRNLVGFNLRRAYNRAALLFSRAFEGLDVAPLQFAALEFISKNPGSCQKDIAHHIGTTPPVLVTPLERLERRGLIQRRRGEADRRRVGVALTREGQQVMQEIEKRILSVDQELVADLSDTERKSFLQLLQKVSEAG